MFLRVFNHTSLSQYNKNNNFYYLMITKRSYCGKWCLAEKIYVPFTIVDKSIPWHVGVGFQETSESWCLVLFEPLGIPELLSHLYMIVSTVFHSKLFYSMRFKIFKQGVLQMAHRYHYFKIQAVWSIFGKYRSVLWYWHWERSSRLIQVADVLHMVVSVLEMTWCHWNSLGCAGCNVKIVIITMLGCAWCFLLIKF